MNTNNTVPFQWALIEQGYTPICRDGEKPEQLVRFEGIKNTKYIIYGLVDGFIRTWTIEGAYKQYIEDQPEDLLLLPPIEVKYLNVYEAGVGFFVESIEKAKPTRFDSFSLFICTLRLTYQNGELINKEIV